MKVFEKSTIDGAAEPSSARFVDRGCFLMSLWESRKQGESLSPFFRGAIGSEGVLLSGALIYSISIVYQNSLLLVCKISLGEFDEFDAMQSTPPILLSRARA